MSRRLLSLVVVAIASLVVSACNSSPTGPRPMAPHFDAAADSTALDSLARIGTSGSNG